MTDSKLIIIAAMVGLKLRCPSICMVYATPLDIIPVYSTGIKPS